MDKFREVKIEGDKSISHRAIILASLGQGQTWIDNILLSQDILITINALRELGIRIEVDEENKRALVHGRGLKGLKKAKAPLYMGNSGTSLRLLAGLLVGQDFESVLLGDSSLNKRPMKRIIEPLSLMGGSIRSENKNQTAPLLIGPSHGLRPIDYRMKVDSAQVKSAIILASLYSPGPSIVREKNVSRNHTERMLDYFQDRSWQVEKLYIPNDISSAGFFMAYGLLRENILMKNIGLNQTRTGMLDLVRQIGGRVEVRNKRLVNNEEVGDIYVYKSRLKPFTIEGHQVVRLIDEIPILALMASLIEGESSIRGAAELRVKETDRIRALSINLRKLGLDLEELPDGMIIKGGGLLKRGVEIDSFQDHRIAMAFEILSKLGDLDLRIRDRQVVNISFPNFYQELNRL